MGSGFDGDSAGNVEGENENKTKTKENMLALAVWQDNDDGGDENGTMDDNGNGEASGAEVKG